MFSDAAPTAESAIAYQCNDILIGNIRPYLRKIWLADRAGGASGDIVIIRIREDYSKILDAKYLYKALSSEQFFDFDNANTKGAKMPRGDRAAIAKYPIPVPPLAEQERIVAELDLLQGTIDKQKAQLKELDTLAQSIFYDMFGDPVENEKGWATSRVIDVVKLQRGYDLPVQKRSQNGSIPVYGSNGIVGTHTISMADKGVVTGRSGTLGKVYVSKIPFYPLNTTLFSIDTHGNDIVYLQYLLTYYDLSRFGTGTGVPTLNRNAFHEKSIIAVPLPLQQAFATKIKAIERQKASINASIAETQKLFDYTMDKYFG